MNPSFSSLRPADLSDPFYYLHNARTLLSWVMQAHGDLLQTDETQLLQQLFSLPDEAQGLLFRMVMRKGEWFRRDQLKYGELTEIDEALNTLEQAGLIDTAPCCEAETLAALCRKDELLQLCQYLWPDKPLPRQTRKRELMQMLLEPKRPAQALLDWWPLAPFRLIRLTCMPLMDRMRLMFFGNLHQDWSEFVLTELGHQRYETVQLATDNRAFSCRSEVDLYVQLFRLQQDLDEGADTKQLCDQLPGECQNRWLENRRQKLAFALAQVIEREGDTRAALAMYRDNPHREARLRFLRLMEKSASPERTFTSAQLAMEQITQPEARIRIERILQRSAKKAGRPFTPCSQTVIPQQTLELQPSGELRVEALVIQHLQTESGQAYHVENRLFTGLFALLFWPALFAPVKGAFFHPFQAGPADLYRPDFADKRQALIDEGFKQLEDGRYRDTILDTLQQKRGVRCSLIHWPTLDDALIENALACIPARDLNAIFRHLLLDLRHHRRGLPDLIWLDPEQRSYRLIEVKGPNDRLQDHQRLWMAFFVNQGIMASLCQVRFLN